MPDKYLRQDLRHRRRSISAKSGVDDGGDTQLSLLTDLIGEVAEQPEVSPPNDSAIRHSGLQEDVAAGQSNLRRRSEVLDDSPREVSAPVPTASSDAAATGEPAGGTEPTWDVKEKTSTNELAGSGVTAAERGVISDMGEYATSPPGVCPTPESEEELVVGVPGDPLLDLALFPMDIVPVSLADKFVVAPLSVLDRRSGLWQERLQRWKRLGVRSEAGRPGRLIYQGGSEGFSEMLANFTGGTSIFDPVLCELVYRWFVGKGGSVLDPFAGGAIRGIAASILGRSYVGLDVSSEQIEANRAQAGLATGPAPVWIEADARDVVALLGGEEFDLIFTCPPYGDLERYSDDPRDLSTLRYEDFVVTLRGIVGGAASLLRDDRFAVVIISDIRRKDRNGVYRGLVLDTINAFRESGLELLNEAVVLDMVATAARRAERPFVRSRKLTRVHQVMLVFVKGDPFKAAEAAGGASSLDLTESPEESYVENDQ